MPARETDVEPATSATGVPAAGEGRAVAGRPPAVVISGLEKSFGPTRALRGVDLRVGRGECHALLGRNGAGKSTLIGILTGLVEADRGTIDVSGAAVGSDGSRVEDVVACVYQKSTLVPDLTVAENIALGAYPRTRLGGVDWRSINATARELLEEWGHGSLAGRLVADLEPIERKIVEICRALARGSCCSTSPPPVSTEARSRSCSARSTSSRRRASRSSTSRTTSRRSSRSATGSPSCATAGTSWPRPSTS